MRLKFSICPLLIALATITYSHIASAQPSPQPAPVSPPAIAASNLSAIEWEADSNRALAKAKKTQKPIMVDFYADWCPACRWLEQKVYKNSVVIAESANFVNVKVNAEHEPKIAEHYGITALPTIVWLDGDGKVLHSLEGAVPAGDFVQEMQTARAIYERKIEAKSQNTGH